MASLLAPFGALEDNPDVLRWYSRTGFGQEADPRARWAVSSPRRRYFARILLNHVRESDHVVAVPIKASPIDLELFRQEISVKYPTFNPQTVKAPSSTPVATAKLSQAYSPIPVRHHYEHDGGDSHQDQSHSSIPHYNVSQPGSGFRSMPQPPTPAPSPPPSPKPKKQQFQTDQSRPFLFPFSRSRIGYNDSRLVPFAIDESDKLYAKHMYVSLSLWQMWKTREECMTVESGLEFLPGAERPSEPKIPPIVSLSTLELLERCEVRWLMNGS